MRVLKLGGSLTGLERLGCRLETWVRQFPYSRTLVVTGGGPWADAVRELDQHKGLRPQSAHRLAIRAMSLVAWTLAQELPNWRWGDRWSDVHQWLAEPNATSCMVFDPAHFLEFDEPGLPGTTLPCGWHVTSDSIAARIAECLAAEQLVLLKSRAPESTNVHVLAQSGFVDPFFQTAARGIARTYAADFRCETALRTIEWSAAGSEKTPSNPGLNGV